MDGFFKFMASMNGRITRAVVGIALVIGGLAIEGAWGWVMVGVGLVPLAAGAFDVCLFSRLFGGPLKGSEIRGD